ncbi:SDR family oxidoreductase [Pseudonocardia humida]|uniref:NAD(P)H-binding protein n=1 Tax=Pseudonocardia humida TaxID=2800819 RepID=A0ABT1A7N6_9PSEU|nr:NAD(P)H-binding protein [Pseudonocardia humida]MCO1659018.1 NAD(P)H-binding protein [Pseudonocardia humida]
MTTVLVTGGTGLLGRAVAGELTAAGHTVRILSRRPGGPGTAVGDLATGAGLDTALQGVDAVVHSASDPRDPRPVDVDGTRRLVAAARRAGEPHLVYVSIVGIDRIPWPYYRAKLAAERAVGASGLPWTILRATQFHEFTADLLARLTRLPVVPAPRGWRFQPVDVREVAARFAATVDAGPAGRLPDLGGPQVLTVAELAQLHLRATGRRRRVVAVPVPGAFSRSLRAGANLAPSGCSAGRTYAEFLAERAGTVPTGSTS